MTVRRFFAGVMMALGGLWTVLCGSCSAYFMVISFRPQSGGGEAQNFDATLGIAAIVLGVLGTAPGLVIYFVGRALWRLPRAQDATVLPPPPEH